MALSRIFTHFFNVWFVLIEEGWILKSAFTFIPVQGHMSRGLGTTTLYTHGIQSEHTPGTLSTSTEGCRYIKRQKRNRQRYGTVWIKWSCSEIDTFILRRDLTLSGLFQSGSLVHPRVIPSVAHQMVQIFSKGVVALLLQTAQRPEKLVRWRKFFPRNPLPT